MASQQELRAASRGAALEAIRTGMPCFFIDGFSREELQELADLAREKYHRILSTTVHEGIIECRVEAPDGVDDWNFWVDFNNWGHVTGRYWIRQELEDSQIPEGYGMTVSLLVAEHLDEKGIWLPDYQEMIEEYVYTDEAAEQLWNSVEETVHLNLGSLDLHGENLLSVSALLTNMGCRNIEVFPIFDVDDDSGHYNYEVEQVTIEDIRFFERGVEMPSDTKIRIDYHAKRRIRMPFSGISVRLRNPASLGKQLQELGFTRIYERPIREEGKHWRLNLGLVDKVLVDGEDHLPIEKDEEYEYDRKLVICYHVKK